MRHLWQHKGCIKSDPNWAAAGVGQEQAIALAKGEAFKRFVVCASGDNIPSKKMRIKWIATKKVRPVTV